MGNLQQKVYNTALIAEKMVRLTLEEKHRIIADMLKTKTQREIADEIGVSESTISDWKTLRRRSGCDDYHVSLDLIMRKLERFIPRDSDDTIKLIQIKRLIESKLKS